jgi:hypothetical protein
MKRRSFGSGWFLVSGVTLDLKFLQSETNNSKRGMCNLQRVNAICFTRNALTRQTVLIIVG